MTQRKDSEPSRASGSRRPPDYVIVVAASDWLKEHFPAAAANLTDACAPVTTATATPSPTWTPNHDPDPEATAMSLKITDTTMTSDHSAHTARHTPGGQQRWEVSWLPGQILDRNSAITAMVLADTAAAADPHEGHRLWPHIQGWAAELGLTAPAAIAQASQPPGDSTHQQDQASRQPDREAAD